MDWQHLLASITGTVDQELLPRNEYLVTQNRILRSQITGRVRLTDDERKTLAEIGQKLSKQALQEECLARLMLCGEKALQHALTAYTTHDHHERNHQDKGNVLLLPSVRQDTERAGPLRCRERLGGLLKYYMREAA